jgi:hypothetical protein
MTNGGKNGRAVDNGNKRQPAVDNGDINQPVATKDHQPANKSKKQWQYATNSSKLSDQRA